ncbi:hypothetical protein Pcinc_041085 [Petrolisthes cinctipes]|uniref:Phorbol-ester/DAG-type domain-containing protein n=1 Tax=Petrolisthes cinctipes TaxID=88211 RepID=A0AAE1BKU0_PETCI|nr:hypothetical protein Pcinc_041085 [Petrolisthes cinctipes]
MCFVFTLQPSTVETQRHVFKAKKVKKARPCHVCHQPVLKLGSCCRVCKYMVHKACEPRRWKVRGGGGEEERRYKPRRLFMR